MPYVEIHFRLNFSARNYKNALTGSGASPNDARTPARDGLQISPMPKTFFILAGEASGDAHAAKLIAQLQTLSPGARCVGLGGPQMSAAGFEAFKDLSRMQVVGFWEVVKQYGFFKRVFYELLDRVKQCRPDALICVDYPGFNLRFAAEVKRLGIPVFYYIVPQVWAWKPGRAKKMARTVDRAFCVFDFEPPFFEKFGLRTEFVGHPLVDVNEHVNEVERPTHPVANSVENNIRTVCFLPGSRASELKHHLAPMLQGFALARRANPPLRGLFSVPAQFSEHDPLLQPLLDAGAQSIGASGSRRIFALWAQSDDAAKLTPVYQALNARPESHARLLPEAADFSVVKSGTSTLEAGLTGNPLCALYKGSFASFAIARMVVNIPVFALVNIVLGRYAVPELLQSEVTAPRIAEEIRRGLFDDAARAKQIAALAALKSKLGGPGASRRAAEGILKSI